MLNADRLNTNEHPRVEFAASQSYTASEQLRRDRLLHYWDSILSRFLADSFVQEVSHGWPSQEAFKQWQRSTLTRRVKRGRGQVAPPEFLVSRMTVLTFCSRLRYYVRSDRLPSFSVG